MRSLILITASRLLITLFLVFSIYMLLRGHNVPGGGFIGGLIGAVGFVIYAFAAGPAQTRIALRADPRSIGTVGLGLALVSALISALAGHEPFTGLWLMLEDLPLSTVLLFDIGVYLAVFGAILTIVLALEETP